MSSENRDWQAYAKSKAAGRTPGQSAADDNHLDGLLASVFEKNDGAVDSSAGAGSAMGGGPPTVGAGSSTGGASYPGVSFEMQSPTSPFGTETAPSMNTTSPQQTTTANTPAPPEPPRRFQQDRQEAQQERQSAKPKASHYGRYFTAEEVRARDAKNALQPPAFPDYKPLSAPGVDAPRPPRFANAGGSEELFPEEMKIELLPGPNDGKSAKNNISPTTATTGVDSRTVSPTSGVSPSASSSAASPNAAANVDNQAAYYQNASGTNSGASGGGIGGGSSSNFSGSGSGSGSGSSSESNADSNTEGGGDGRRNKSKQRSRLPVRFAHPRTTAKTVGKMVQGAAPPPGKQKGGKNQGALAFPQTADVRSGIPETPQSLSSSEEVNYLHRMSAEAKNSSGGNNAGNNPGGNNFDNTGGNDSGFHSAVSIEGAETQQTVVCGPGVLGRVAGSVTGSVGGIGGGNANSVGGNNASPGTQQQQQQPSDSSLSPNLPTWLTNIPNLNIPTWLQNPFGQPDQPDHPTRDANGDPVNYTTGRGSLNPSPIPPHPSERRHPDHPEHEEHLKEVR